jgi:hypothetical protein
MRNAVGADLPRPLLRARRRRLLAGGTLVVVLLTAVAVKLAMMLVAQDLGSRAWDGGDPVSAGRYFGMNQHLNLVQTWIAPYNLAVAKHGHGEWQDADAFYEDAWQRAPEDAQCRIALNWGSALESAGDAAKRANDRDLAQRYWKRSKGVLDRADGCDQVGDRGASGTEPHESDQPSPTSTPTAAPSATPSPSARPTRSGAGDQQTEDPGKTGSEAGSGREGAPKPGSEQDKLDKAKQRVDQKLGVPAGQRPEEDGTSEQERAERLGERNQKAVQQRQRMQDDKRKGGDDSPKKSW